MPPNSLKRFGFVVEIQVFSVTKELILVTILWHTKMGYLPWHILHTKVHDALFMDQKFKWEKKGKPPTPHPTRTVARP
jgi:hypothetical protein